MKLNVLDKSYAILRLESSAEVPAWVNVDSEFFSVTRTAEELSIVCPETLVAAYAAEIANLDIKVEAKRRIVKVEGILDFALTGILSQLLLPLAEAKISVFTISTFDTDYILLHEDKLGESVQLMREKGHEISGVGIASPKRVAPWRPPVLETSRLILRPVELVDAHAIYEYAKNPKVSLYTLWEPHTSVEESLDFIRDYIHPKYAQGLVEPYGVELKSLPGKIIGTVGCFWTSKAARAMELAYAIGEEHWGKGIVAEASQAVMEHCFKEYNLKRIQARCKSENKQSSRVMQKVGMVYEGRLKSAIVHRDRFWDMDYYAKVLD